MTRADIESDEPFGIWPDNWLPLQVFNAMGTQWRAGMSGATGLDYGVMREVMALLGVAPEQHTDVFDCVRAMESAALDEMHKKD